VLGVAPCQYFSPGENHTSTPANQNRVPTPAKRKPRCPGTPGFAGDPRYPHHCEGAGPPKSPPYERRVGWGALTCGSPYERLAQPRAEGTISVCTGETPVPHACATRLCHTLVPHACAMRFAHLAQTSRWRLAALTSEIPLRKAPFDKLRAGRRIGAPTRPSV
jgi:hypothetical protein